MHKDMKLKEGDFLECIESLGEFEKGRYYEALEYDEDDNSVYMNKNDYYGLWFSVSSGIYRHLSKYFKFKEEEE